jgi:hypothetical protein
MTDISSGSAASYSGEYVYETTIEIKKKWYSSNDFLCLELNLMRSFQALMVHNTSTHLDHTTAIINLY